ncbi:hypothetical protein ACSHT2_06055 [Bradyrhizobium sp. PUT101]
MNAAAYKFEDHYEAALIDLINQKRADKTSDRRSGRRGRTWSI